MKQIEELKKGDLVYEVRGNDIYKGEVEDVKIYKTVVIVKIKGLYQDHGYGYVTGIKGGWTLHGRFRENLFFTELDYAARYIELEKEKSKVSAIMFYLDGLKRQGVNISVSI